MSLRIAREKVYLPVLLDKRRIAAMRGMKSYVVPLSEVELYRFVENELASLGRGEAARCLVVQLGDWSDNSMGLDAVYSAGCLLTKKNGAECLRLVRIEPLDIALCWRKDQKFYQRQMIRKDDNEEAYSEANGVLG